MESTDAAVHLMFGGDVMLGRGVGTELLRRGSAWPLGAIEARMLSLIHISEPTRPY